MKREANEQTEENRKRVRESVEREQRDLARSRAELAEMLKLPADSPTATLTAALWDVRRRIDRDAEVERLTDAIDSVRRALDRVALPAALQVPA